MTTSDLFIELLRCELNGLKPEPGSIPAETLTELLDLSRRHSLAALTAYALEDAGIVDPRFTEEKYRAIYTTAQQLCAGKEVCDFLEKSGIRHMPLKGMALQELYPKPGMRQMSDCDIFYDESAQETVKSWFQENGYTSGTYDVGHHDVYRKNKQVSIEMHRVLIDLYFQAGWISDSNAVWQQAALCPGSGSRYAFSPEDELIYLTAHASKHLQSRGNGFRALADLYLFQRAHSGELDRERVRRKLEEARILETGEPLLRLSERLFAPGSAVKDLSEEERELMEYMLSSGTRGSYEQGLRNRLREIEPDRKEPDYGTKLRYCLKRIHPGREQILRVHPYFRRHSSAMLPLFRVYRFFRAVFRPSKAVKHELRTLFRLR